MTKLFASTLILLLVGTALQAQSALFSAGQSSWQIALPEKATPTEKYAAEELQTALHKISGVKLQIINGKPAKNSDVIYLGTPQNNPAIAAKNSALKLKTDNIEESAILSDGQNLYLAGNMPRGVLYAVYSFLREEMNVRWFWPGDDGEFMPKMATYNLPEISRHIKPQFRFREMTPCWLHTHIPTEKWLARNFMNGGSRTKAVRDVAGFHKLDGQHWVAIDKKMFDKQPELFSMISGKRRPEGEAGCWSNPEFTKYIIEKHKKLMKEKGFEILNTFPADIVPRCECKECTKNPDPSSRWYDYYYKLIQELKKDAPNLQFAGIAYQEYRSVPSTPVKGLEYVEYCQYNRCYVHKLGDKSCGINQKSMAELRDWQKKAPMGIYGYEFDVFSNDMYLPFWNMLGEEMKLFRDMKLVRMKTEMAVRYPQNAKRWEIPQQAHRLANYMYTQLVWNPDANVDALLKDWCEKVYGKGADAMYQYHKSMADSWDKMKIHLSYFGAKPLGSAKHLLNPQLIAQAKKYFADAQKAVTNSNDPQKKRFLEEINIEKELFSSWEKLYMVARDNAATFNVPLLPVSSDSFDKVARLAVTSAKNTHQPTDMRLYRSKDALHIRVTAHDKDMKNIRKGVTGGRDVKLWNDDMIEMFIDTKDGMPYRHMAANIAGGTYDAIGSDRNWDPKWSSKSTVKDDRWTMEITIPFAELGTPKNGDQWLLQIIRNSKPEACAYPAVSYHDMSGAATLIFNDKNTNPDKNLIWLANKPRKAEALRQNMLNSGWNFTTCIGTANAAKADLSDAKVIVIDNYQLPLPLEFYSQKLVPAIKNGAIVVYSAYFWIDQLAKQYDDPTFAVKFVEDAHKLRKPVRFAASTMVTKPFNLKTTQWHTPSGNFVPANPEKWENIAWQKSTDESEKPFIIVRPLGKGMVVLCGDAVEFHTIVENAMEYNKEIKR